MNLIFSSRRPLPSVKIKASDQPSCPAETAANQQAASISRVERRVAIAAAFVSWPETRLLIYLFSSTNLLVRGGTDNLFMRWSVWVGLVFGATKWSKKPYFDQNNKPVVSKMLQFNCFGFFFCLFLTEDTEHDRHFAEFNWTEYDGLPGQDFWEVRENKVTFITVNVWDQWLCPFLSFCPFILLLWWRCVYF